MNKTPNANVKQTMGWGERLFGACFKNRKRMINGGCIPGAHILISITPDGSTVDKACAICPQNFIMTGRFDVETGGVILLEAENVRVVRYERLLLNNYFNLKNESKTLHYLVSDVVLNL